MSAFMVSHATIDVIVDEAAKLEYGSPWSYYHNGERHTPASGPSAFERMLLEQNVVSLAARYGGEERLRYPEVQTYTFRPPRVLMTPGAVAKALACYRYQACEDDGWETSEAHAATLALQLDLLSSLPGYEAAEWDCSDERVHGKEGVTA